MASNISRLSINASPQKVWEVLTKPELVKLWQYGSDLQTTWEVGTRIKFVTKWEGNVFEQWGTVLEFSPAQKVRYSLFAPRPGLEDKPENYFVMIYSLSGTDGQTALTITQEDNRPHAVQEAEQGEDNPILKLLKEIAESNE